MPYYTGTANSAADLVQAIVNAGTANGWTWDSTNAVLYKGDIYAKLTTSGSKAYVQTALGYSGSRLTNPAPVQTGIRDDIIGGGAPALSYPLNYHIFVHTSHDDIICAVQYQSTYWQWLAFGQARNLGVSGKCVWQWGTCASDVSTAVNANTKTVSLALLSDQTVYSCWTSGAPFWLPYGYVYAGRNASLHVSLDGIEWVSNKLSTAQATSAFVRAAQQIIAMTPSAWNGHTILAPCAVFMDRASGLASAVCELPHIRMTRNDYLNDGQIITIGPDKWFVAPVARKETASRDVSVPNGSRPSHSGTIAVAIRYDGP